MGTYMPGAICRRGHVITSDTTTSGRLTSRCGECGAEVLTTCPACGKQIRGDYKVPGVLDLTGGYKAPSFCGDCGAPFPWVGRQGRIYELMNRLDQEDLDPATELTVREQLEALANPDIDEDEELRRWERVKKLAPDFWEKAGARAILVTLVSAYIKDKLGLHG
jgi:hypothetical protein